MSDLGNLVVRLQLDYSKYDADLAQKKLDTAKIAQELANSFRKTTLSLTPKVDDSCLTKLNQHLELKRVHFKSVQKFFDTQPLTPKVNLTELAKLDTLTRDLKDRKVNVAVKLQVDDKDFRNASINAQKESKEIVEALKRVQEQIKKQKRGNSFLGSIVAGVGEGVGIRLASSALDLSKSQFKKVKVAAQLYYEENESLQKTVESLSKKLEARLRKVGYKLGDGIVASLEDLDGDLADKLNIFIKTSFDRTSVTEGLKDLQTETTESLKDIGGQIFNEDILRKYFKTVGNELRKYREVALQERAVPLVKERARQIVNSGKTNNTGNSVTESTEELIVAVGGYAGARGLSGKALKKDIAKNKREGQEVIWVANKDSDLPKSSMGNAKDKAMALGISLGKPNLRGYSNDALEMAAQALAAIEKNPEIKIKFVGESGGGYAAEEATKILELLGHKNSSYIGVGTPDFIGELGAKGNKIISSDETLGIETNRLYKRLGLTNRGDNKLQNLLGVEEHPFVNYQEAKIGEVENYVKGGLPQPSSDDISGFQKAVDAYKNLDLEELSSRELAEVNSNLFANLQLIRNHAYSATGDLEEELQLIASEFEALYVKTTPDNSDFNTVKSALKRAKEIYKSLQGNEGLEASGIADQIEFELLQIKKEFSEKYKNSVGTTSEKYKVYNSELDDVISQYKGSNFLFKEPPQEELGIELREIPLSPTELLDQPTALDLAIQTTRKFAKGVIDAGSSIVELGSAIINSNPSREIIRISKQLYAVAEGIESAAFDLVPLLPAGALKSAKTPIRNTALFMGATHLPGANMAFEALSSGIELAATTPIAGALTQMGSAATGAIAPITNTLAHIPGMGGLTAELSGSVATGATNVAGLIGGGIADVATPLIGGGLVAKGISAAGKAVLPEVNVNQKAISSATEQKLLKATSEFKKTVNVLQSNIRALEDAKNTARKLLPVGAGIGVAYLESVEKTIPSLQAVVDSAIEALPKDSDDRNTREFAQLANIKKRLGDVTQTVKKLSEENNKRKYKNSVNKTIDVQSTTVVDTSKVAKESIAELGSRFKKSVDAIPILLKDQTSTSTEAAKGIALGILSKVDEARSAIEELLESTADVTPQLKAEVKTARLRITNSEKSARKFLGDDHEVDDIGRNTASGISKGIGDSISQVKESAHLLSQTLVETVKDDLEIHSPSEVFRRLGEFIIEGLDKGLSIGQGLNTSFIEPLLDFARQNIQWFPDIEDQAKSLLTAAASLGGLTVIIGLFQNLGAAAIEVAKEFERFEIGINFASRGSGAARRNIATLESQISDLNVDIRGAYDGYTKLLASTKETPLENMTDKINESLLQAAAVYQLDQESTKRMFLAVQQIASKGTVSSEEIKLQLGEVLPGSFNISARAMGMTTGELSKNLELGNVQSTEFLPKFAQQLNSETDIAASTISETSTGKMNEFNNSLVKLQLNLGKKLLPANNLGLDVLNGIMKPLIGNLGLISQAFLFLISIIGVNLLKALGGLVKGLFTTRTAMFGLGQTASAVAGMIGKVTARFLLFTVITDTLSLVWKSFQDGSGAIKDFTDASTKNLDLYKKAVVGAQKVGAIKPPITETRFNPSKGLNPNSYIKGKSDLEETFIGGFIDIAGSAVDTFGIRNTLNKYNKGDDNKLSRDIENSLGLLFGGGKVQRTNKDTLKNTDIIFDNNEYIKTEIERLFSDPNSDLNKTISIDQQIEAINKKKRALNPNDKSAIRDLQAQEDILIKQRETPFDSVGKMSSTIQTQIEGIQNTIKEFDDLQASGGITDADYKSKTDKLKVDLKSLRDLQDKFNAAIKGGVSQAQLLEMQFNRITATLKDSITAIDIKNSKNQAQISDAQANGDISKVQSDFAKISAQQEALREKIAANNKALSQSQTIVNNPNIQEVLTRYGLQGQGSESIQAFITNRSLQQGEFKDSKDGKYLAVAQNSVAQNEQLQREIADSQAQLSEQRLQTQESIRDLSRSLFDFFRNASDTADDLNQSVAETNLETEVVKAKNRLNSKLKGFSNRFFGELTSQLSELIDTLFEPLRNGLNAQNQIRGYQKQLRDQIQSGNDLVGQFQPGGGGVANTGSVAGSAQKSGLYTAPQSNNGGSAEYHIDTKFSRTLSLDQIVAMLDQLAAGYRQQGRQMMFSNSAVNGEVYDETANIEEKKKLAQRAMEAHSHSVSENYQSLDYYIPNRGEGLHSSSVENAEMLIPTLPGMNLEYGSGGRYGNYVAGVVNGEVVFKQGHGDDSRPLPQNRTVSSQPTQSAANTTSQPTPQPTPQSSGGINAATLREAIIEKESSGRHDIVNRHSGALGLYQVMPDNLPRWSQQVVGREVSKDEFLSNPQLQTQIVTGIMQDMLDTAQAATSDPREQVRRVASEWYSGRQERFDNPNPQYTDGQEYPSIRAYTNDIADKYERLTVSGGSPAQATTQNGTRIDPSMVQSGNNLVRAGVDNAIAATEAQLAALDQQAAIRLRQTIDQIKRTQRDGIEELNDTAIAEQRKLEDLQVQGEPETPELNYQIQIRDINRQEQDATRDLSRTIREIKEGLEILEATRQEILELGKTNPQVLELIPGLEQSIATSQSRLAELQSVYDNYAEAFGANRRKITEEFVRAEENRQFAFRSTRRSIDSQSSDALAQDYTLRGDGRRAIGVNETERVAATNFDVDSRIRDLEEQLRTKSVTQDEFDNAKRALEEYRRLALDNISRSSENDRDNFDITQGEALANSRIDLFQGQADSLAARGFTRQSRDIQREIAIEQQNLSFSSQLAELERMADSGAYAAETIDQLRQNLTDLNAIKLEDINTEFDTGSQIFKTFQDTAKNSLASLITGAESAQQVLEGFFNSLATSLANMASDFLLSEIFGLLGGIGGRGKGAETENKGFLGDALGVGVGVGMSLFTAASGGEVPKMNMSGLRDRPDSIGRALRKEGSNSVLAALTPGELVLSVEKAKKFNELGMGEVLNFKNGGMVGAASPRFSPTMRGGDINIPVNISGEGSNSGGLDIGRIREAVRTSVVEELNYQARPRGINYKG